jgi:leader peptidase (prepilin peptidase) / N-methyltransferase
MQEWLLLTFFVFWGSFLNMLGYRLLHEQYFWRPRSFCPHCLKTIAWYDLIPIASWLLLGGKCRWCKAPISLLYPFIELITPILLMSLYHGVPAHYFPAYFFFFSALIISIRTDLESMLISRWVSIFAVPVGWILAGLGFLPITLKVSVVGSLAGYLLLWIVGHVFMLITKQPGLGLGDVELLSFIGAFIGPLGAWITLIVGSFLGTIGGTIQWAATKSRKIPFGPFLALGAISYVLFQSQLIRLFISVPTLTN